MSMIDTHAHVFSAQSAFIANARYRPDYTACVEDYINILDDHGFGQGVLIQPSFLGTNNEEMLSAIAKFPDRLKGVAVLDPTMRSTELETLNAQGILGVRLNLFGLPCPDLRQKPWSSFLARLSQFGWQLELHAPPSFLIQLLPQLSPYDLDVVIDHFGRVDPDLGAADPDYQQLLSQLDPRQHWVKVSGYYRLDHKQYLQPAIDAFHQLLDCGMRERLVWGSDWPHTQYESQMSFSKALHNFETIVDDANLVKKIITENNARLFQF